MRRPGPFPDRRGSVSLMAAGCFSLLVVIGSVAVDFGYAQLQKRKMQSAADLAAISAAGDIAGARSRAVASLTANGVPEAAARAAEVVVGRYRPDGTRAAEARFDAAATPANAVRVTVGFASPSVFSAILGADGFTGRVSGTAEVRNFGALSAGSGLARLQGGLANDLLGALVGGRASLSLVDHAALANADVDAFAVLDRLAARLRLSAGTYGGLLSASVTLPDYLSVLAEVARVPSLRIVADAADRERAVPLSALVGLRDVDAAVGSAESTGLTARTSAAALLAAGLSAANRGRTLHLDARASVPGLATVAVDAVVGEPMRQSAWMEVGGDGAVTVSTAQVRVRLVATVGGSGVLAGLALRVPLLADVASGEATLRQVPCGGRTAALVEARAGLAALAVGEVDPARLGAVRPEVGPARILTTPLLSVTGTATVTADTPRTELLRFSRADIERGTLRTAGSHGVLAGLVGSALGRTRLDVRILGLTVLSTGQVTAAVAATLGSITTPADAALESVLDQLGIAVGYLDVRVNGYQCGRGTLVY